MIAVGASLAQAMPDPGAGSPVTTIALIYANTVIDFNTVIT